MNDTINEIFTTIFKQMLTAIKHIANDNFVFQQDNAPAHHVCNTVQLLESETLNFTSFDYALTQQRTPLIIRFKESYISINICCESTRLKKLCSDWYKSCNVQYSIEVKRGDFRVSNCASAEALIS